LRSGRVEAQAGRWKAAWTTPSASRKRAFESLFVLAPSERLIGSMILSDDE